MLAMFEHCRKYTSVVLRTHQRFTVKSPSSAQDFFGWSWLLCPKYVAREFSSVGYPPPG
jgi:hypothetical protein